MKGVISITKLEKFFTITFRLLGISYLIVWLLFLFNIYHPNKFGIACNMFIIGFICLFVNYTEKKDKEVSHD